VAGERAGSTPGARRPWYGTAVFTGLVQAKGRLRRSTPRGPGYRLEIDATLGVLELGESISVSGACLTVVAHDATGFAADVTIETRERTTLGSLSPGDPVNLERSLRIGDRLDGHLVTGHVDGIAVVSGAVRQGEATRVVVEPPAELGRFIAAKGSVCLDGVSLTVNEVRGLYFDVMVIPHTEAVTTLTGLAPGKRLNLEVDLLARYVVRYLERGDPQTPGLEDALRRGGFLS